MQETGEDGGAEALGDYRVTTRESEEEPVLDTQVGEFRIKQTTDQKKLSANRSFGWGVGASVMT